MLLHDPASKTNPKLVRTHSASKTNPKLVRTHSASKTNPKLVRTHSASIWCWDKPRATLDSFDSPWPGLGEATTFPHIVFFALLCGSHIRMALFPETPKEESRTYPGLNSWDFEHSYLLALTFDWSEVSTKVVVLLENFPMPHRTPSADVVKRSIPNF
jgi:hypothetical protein